MTGYVCGIDWINAEAMKYWSPPASYSLEKKKTEIHNAIFGGNYLGALKVDGYYQRLIKDEDGNCFMIARSKNVKGEAVNKIEWVPHIMPFMASLPNGTVLLSECFIPHKEGSKNVTSLLGCLKEKCIARQQAGVKLCFYIYDVCAYNNQSFVNTAAEQRFAFLESLREKHNDDYVAWAKYYSGEELWKHLQKYLASGREGIVITRNDCKIYFKRTPAHMTIKIKKELQDTIDVVITGANPPTQEYTGKEISSWRYWQNTKTGEKYDAFLYEEFMAGSDITPVTKSHFYGWAGSLNIGARCGDRIVTIGSLSGLTEEVLSNWKDYVGKVAEITAMEVMKDTCGLRHPKFLQWRPDKTPADTNWELIFGDGTI